MENNKDIEEFYIKCEYYIMKNVQRFFALPTSSKLQEIFKYILVYHNIVGQSRLSDNDFKVAHDYLCEIWFSEEEFNEILSKIGIQDKLLLLLDYIESYLVDEIEKDMYGHGDKCYTSLFNDLNLVLRIKQQNYDYKFASVHDLLVNGYFFDDNIAEKFDRLAVSHTPEECPN